MTIRHLYSDVAPALNLDFANTKRLDPRITFTRSSTGTYVDELGVIKTAASNEARFDHDSDGNSLGLLIEESRTNTLGYSADIVTQLNSVSNASIASNTVIAPDGTLNADTITFTAAGYVRTSSNNIAINGSIWSYSIFLKAGTVSSGTIDYNGRASCSFDLTAETVSFTIGSAGTAGGGIDKLGNGWYRVYVVYDATSDINRGVRIISQSAGTLHAWGIQNEAGSFPTSYIPTSGSTATRSADVASMTGTNFSSWYNQSEGTVLSQYLGGLSNTQTAVGIDDNTSSNQLNLYGDNGTGYCTVVTGGAVVANLTLGTLLSSTSNKICVAYKANDFASLINSGNVLTDTSGALPVVSQLRIGNSQGGSRLTGTISRLTYYDRRLTDAQLQALTL